MRRRYFPILFSSGGVTPAPANIWTPRGVALDANLAGEELQVQEPTVIYEGGTFKMWYSMGYVTRSIGYATSSDGLNWTKYASNPVVESGTRCHVMKNGSTYYMYLILSPGGYSRLSSADGITWATDATGILANGDPGSFDVNGPANTFVWIEDGTWYKLYDGGDGTVYRMGLATSPDGLTWTKSASNPVLDLDPGSEGNPWAVKVNGAYHMYNHIAASGTLPTDFAKFQSSNLTSWVRTPAGLVYPRTTRDEGVGSVSGQVADGCLVEAGGTTYLFYTAMENGAQATAKIKVATAPYPLENVILSDGGMVAGYYPEIMLNGGFERLGAGEADIFASWTESLGTGGTIERTTGAGEFASGTSGIAAVKLTSGAGMNTAVSQSIPAANFTAGATYRISGKARGDGTNSGRLRVFASPDLLLDWDTFSIVTGTSFAAFSRDVTYAGSSNVVIYCYCPKFDGGISYFDDISLKRIA
jgi:hypothetical protein